MMMTMMTMTMIEIKMKLRQTFDDKTEEIQARDHSPAWIFFLSQLSYILQNVFHNLLIEQAIIRKQLLHIISIVETLSDAAHHHLHF